MDIKEWLNRARELDKEINQLIEERDRALNMACTCTSATSADRVQMSKGNATEDKFINYVEYTNMIDKMIDDLIEDKNEILNVIHKVNNSTYRTLLIARYINCKTWEQIAEDINKSDKWTRTRMHSRALQAVEKTFTAKRRG